jgi:N4-gp56 family major capsid protein
MAEQLETGLLLSNMLPLAYRPYYQAQLLDVIRRKAIWYQYVRVVPDFNAVRTKQIVLTEVYDLHPAIGTLQEGVPFAEGAYLDADQYVLTVSEHGNVLKTNSFATEPSFWNSGDFKGLVRDKMGRNVVESMELQARNAHLGTQYLFYSPKGAGATPTSRDEIAADDIFGMELASLSRTNLMSRDAVGLQDESVVCLCHPRQSHDVREAAGSKWLDKMSYANPGAILRGEVGMCDGVRYVNSNFSKLPNAGAIVAQTALTNSTSRGQGGPKSDKANLLNYVVVDAVDGFAVGQEVTIHTESLGAAVTDADALAEHRQIVNIDIANKRLYFDRALLVAHTAADYVTEARDIYAAAVIGGQSVALAVAQLPSVIVPPVIDDYGRINRVSWYAVYDYQLLRDLFVEVYLTAASTADHGVA